MLKRPSLWLTPIALIAALSAAHAQEQATADTVIATVNGVEITAANLLMMRAQLPQQYQSIPNADLFEGLVDQAVQQALLASQVKELDLASRVALQNQERNMLANIEVQRLFEDALTDEAIQEAYDARFAAAEPVTEFNASHILVETEEEAAAIKEELDNGADFSAMARDKSTGPSAPNGGNLGWFQPGMMVPEFEQAVAALETGEISEPVQTQFGWHVVKLNEKRLAEQPALEEVRDELVAELQTQIIEARIAELTNDAEITKMAPGDISPDFLSDPALLQN